MEYLLSNEERLKLCIKALEDIKNTHSVKIVMGDRIVRDRAYIQAKECLDKVMELKPELTDEENYASLSV